MMMKIGNIALLSGIHLYHFGLTLVLVLTLETLLVSVIPLSPYHHELWGLLIRSFSSDNHDIIGIDANRIVYNEDASPMEAPIPVVNSKSNTSWMSYLVMVGLVIVIFASVRRCVNFH